MAEEHGSRRLAVIVAADIAGYSRLVSRDERGTLNALRSHRSEFIEPTIRSIGAVWRIRPATACC